MEHNRIEKEMMIDFKDSFYYLMREVHDNSKSKGFWHEGYEKRNKAEMIALMHSELSECLEAIRKNPQADEHCPQYLSETIELADCIIRIMDYAEAFNLPLASAIIAKHNFNKTRPHKHGKEF